MKAYAVGAYKREDYEAATDAELYGYPIKLAADELLAFGLSGKTLVFGEAMSEIADWWRRWSSSLSHQELAELLMAIK